MTTREGGAARIFFYNWPTYVATWFPALAILVFFPLLHFPGTWLAVVAAGGAIAWSIVSLVISFYIYDASSLVSGRWVPGLVTVTGPWATIHAGLDAEVELDAVMRGTCVARLDIFDREIMTSRSIARARARTPASNDATPCAPSRLTLEDEACETIVVAFTAHEIRDRGAREAFFCELRRSLRPGGKALLVEHLRDLPNFIAFGPGFLHFVSRREWMRLASHAKLTVLAETRITPWVMALTLETPKTMMVLLRVAGASLIMLSLFHAALWRMLDWGPESERLSPLTARVFFVHTGFIAFVLGALGLLSLIRPDLLLAPSELARLLLIGIIVFWIARLVIQPLVFDRVMRTGWTRSHVVRIGATLVWAFYVAIYGLALLQQFRAGDPR